jgi:hypothetical protein
LSELVEGEGVEAVGADVGVGALAVDELSLLDELVESLEVADEDPESLLPSLLEAAGLALP